VAIELVDVKQDEAYDCECIKCGHAMTAEAGTHCKDITCPECGGEMRRAERPGPGKEVGQIKFVLPNDFNIFLSDASSENLFDRAKRDLNYRCISVERASELAVTLLDDRKWKIGKVNKSMQSEVPVKASLKEKLPVYITYRTAWVDENGRVNFRRDIYGYDAAQYQLTQPEETFETDF
jgi:murein L,D-transpeptidase YcbB/YkuD